MGFEDWTTEELKKALSSERQERDLHRRLPGLGGATSTYRSLRERERTIDQLKDEIERRENK
jgi:hypothetical protein